MSDEIGRFAEDISDTASIVGAIDTDGITGSFGATLNEQKQALAGTLEEFGDTLHQLQDAADEHRRSEATFVATAPTLAEVEQAAKELLNLQDLGPTVQSSPIPAVMGIDDSAYVQAVESAQKRFNQLSQERRDAVRVFLDEQNRVVERINSTAIPAGIERTNSERGSAGLSVAAAGPSGASTTVTLGAPSSAVPSSSGGSSGRSPSDSPASEGGGAGRASVEDVLAAGTPVAAAGAAPMMFPQAGMANPAAMAGRIGPPVMPGYVLPGTVTSAGQVTPMSDREFNSLLDRLRSDRGSVVPSVPTTPSGSGGGGGLPGSGGPAAGPRVVQPTSWANASSPTGVSEAQNSRSPATPSSTGPAASTRPGMMPPVGPMAPMSPNSVGGHPKHQPHIKNADPDVYGDDVQTTDPIIDNQKGRFA
ncbi:MAG: hypothetical protein WAW17_14600 [Rhodococcus sp. (in: high G+C Gram-positive bacteria)]|uniref:hypothetical protein n=1 Tax=Rhodococcus sp. TaxID=1831 RepID=UPI003BB0623C